MILLRSALFILFLWLWTATMTLLYTPLLVLPRRWTVLAARFWIRGALIGLKLFTGLGWEVRGREHLPAGGMIIASKHQSTFETFAMHLMFDDPAYVLKRELLWIPCFGWYLFKSGVIAIDRSAGTRALKTMVKGAETAAAEGRPIVIFPEGTRAAPGTKRPYHSGVAMLYGALDLPVVPIALNSGVFWGRGALRKYPGTLTIEILPPIAPGLDRRAFMAELEQRIETASDRLVAEARHALSERGIAAA
ncbi:lysophospholipid acyltransferase family protein [Phaeospirillum tilakii]|uniref:Lysophospholipid acyltransferase family protein n=1 Tax=Phaeospirillum tilakii TaxID=741673 RepID=A0ABW5CCA4_9PROT